VRIDSLEAEPTKDGFNLRVTATMGRYHVMDPQGITKFDFGNGVVGYAVSDGAVAYEPPPIVNKQ
jgi:hypothetical protein